jgi:hypothetical protein
MTTTQERKTTTMLLLLLLFFWTPLSAAFPTPHHQNYHYSNTMSHDDSSLLLVCPLTNQKLPQDPLERGYIYASPIPPFQHDCGHVCTLQALCDYIQTNTKQKGVAKCPTCRDSFIISVCDGVAAKYLCQADDDIPPSLIIAFRYGPQSYWLSVVTTTTTREDSHNNNQQTTTATTVTAQERIQQVLRMDDLQILHRGRRIYPSPPDDSSSALSNREMSKQLLEISYQDIVHQQKPTLIVVGKPVGHYGAQGGRLHK